MEKKNVTFGDIAKYTGFSKTTISRFFNNPDSLTPKHQDIIRKALKDLDYKENKVAQILAKGHTEFVGLIIPNLYIHYYSEMLNQILQTYEEYGYKFLVFVGSQNPEIEKKYIRELMSYKIEGLLVMSHTLSSEELASLPVPVVCIEREDRFVSSVNCDNYAGARKAAGLLHEHKCSIMIHINTPTDEAIPAYRRIDGFRDYCIENHLPYEIIIRDTGASLSSIRSVMQELLEEIEKKYPDQRKGIFFSDDTRAKCFLNMLLRKFNRLPESYRLVGFDNSPVAEEAAYSISTVGQQIEEIAREAVSMLIRQIEGKKEGTAEAAVPVHKVITPVLYRRETTEL